MKQIVLCLVGLMQAKQPIISLGVAIISTYRILRLVCEEDFSTPIQLKHLVPVEKGLRRIWSRHTETMVFVLAKFL
jgi:hypothetical protein